MTIRDDIEIAPPQSGNSGSARLGRCFAVDMRGAPPRLDEPRDELRVLYVAAIGSAGAA
jgi:hypothetical protein